MNMVYEVFPWCDLHVKGMDVSNLLACENNKSDVRYESRGKEGNTVSEYWW